MTGSDIVHIIFRMNNPKYVKAMPRVYTEKVLEQIQLYMKENHAECCVQCEAYYNEFDKDGYCIGYRCALDDNIKIDDREKMHDDCPLLKEGSIFGT